MSGVVGVRRRQLTNVEVYFMNPNVVVQYLLRGTLHVRREALNTLFPTKTVYNLALRARCTIHSTVQEEQYFPTTSPPRDLGALQPRTKK